MKAAGRCPSSLSLVSPPTLTHALSFAVTSIHRPPSSSFCLPHKPGRNTVPISTATPSPSPPLPQPNKNSCMSERRIQARKSSLQPHAHRPHAVCKLMHARWEGGAGVMHPARCLSIKIQQVIHNQHVTYLFQIFFCHDCDMNLSDRHRMHLICLPADGTLDFMVIIKGGGVTDLLGAEAEGCSHAHISYLRCLNKVFFFLLLLLLP